MDSLNPFHSCPDLRQAILTKDEAKLASLFANDSVRSTFLEWADSHAKRFEGNLFFRKIVHIAENQENLPDDPTELLAKSFHSFTRQIQKIFKRTIEPSPLDLWLQGKKISNNEFIKFLLSNETGILSAYYELGLINDSELKDLFSIQSRSGGTLLHHRKGFEKTFLPLLEKLADKEPALLKDLLSIKNNKDQTPLHDYVNFEMALPLLEKLADKKPALFKDLLSIKDNEGQTLLHMYKNLKKALPLLRQLSENNPPLLKEVLSIRNNKGISAFAIFISSEIDNDQLLENFLNDLNIELNEHDIRWIAKESIPEIHLLKIFKLLIKINPQQNLPLILKDPKFANLLLKEAPSLLENLIQEKTIDLQQMSREEKLNLLPLFSPDEIADLIQNTSKEQWESLRMQLLMVEPDQLEVTTEQLLKKISQEYGPGQYAADSEENSLRIGSAASSLIQIPFACLAEAMQHPELVSIITGYFDSFSPSQQQTIVTAFSLNNFLEMAVKSWKKIDPFLISRATTEQKLFILEQMKIEKEGTEKDVFYLDPTLVKEIKTNNEKWKSDLENLQEEKSEQNYKELKDSIQKFQQQRRLQLNTFEDRVNKLKTILLENSDSKELYNKVHEKIDPLLDEIRTAKESIQKLQKELTEIGKMFESKEEEEISEEFIDPITNEMMKDPVSVVWGDKPSDQLIVDRSTAIQFNGISPYTRAPIIALKEMSDLKQRIQDYQNSKKPNTSEENSLY